MAAVGPNGEALFDYAILDAYRAGYRRFVLVVREQAVTRFQEHAEAVWKGALEIAWAVQEPPPEPRLRPWGTAHAVLSARPHARTPFAVINADDWYPPRGYRDLADALDMDTPDRHALIAYPLNVTPMSQGGGVSRGVCEIGRDGTLHDIIEVQRIRPSGEGYVGNSMGGDVVVLSGTELVSMNLWGFHPSIFPLLADGFAAFRDSLPGDDEEFLLASVVRHGIRSGRCNVHAIVGTGAGFGMTYRADLPAVTERIADLVSTGHYPSLLHEGLN